MFSTMQRGAQAPASKPLRSTHAHPFNSTRQRAFKPVMAARMNSTPTGMVTEEHPLMTPSQRLDVNRRQALLYALALLPTLQVTAMATPLLARAEEQAADSSADIRTVLVVGSTGQTGRRVVSELRARGFQVKAGVRDLKKGQGLGLALVPGVELVEADVLKPEQLAKAMTGVQAVVCATGYTGFSPNGSVQVDETGTRNLIDAAKKAGVGRFVLLTSLLTNAKAAGQEQNPNYKFLNLFGGVLDHKLAAEKYLRDSGLTWTVVRPGGLSNDPPAKVGNLVVSKEDTLFGLPTDPGREISRDTVAQVLAAALQQPSAANKLVEIVSSPIAVVPPETEWFP